MCPYFLFVFSARCCCSRALFLPIALGVGLFFALFSFRLFSDSVVCNVCLVLHGSCIHSDASTTLGAWKQSTQMSNGNIGFVYPIANCVQLMNICHNLNIAHFHTNFNDWSNRVVDLLPLASLQTSKYCINWNHLHFRAFSAKQVVRWIQTMLTRYELLWMVFSRLVFCWSAFCANKWPIYLAVECLGGECARQRRQLAIKMVFINNVREQNTFYWTEYAAAFFWRWRDFMIVRQMFYLHAKVIETAATSLWRLYCRLIHEYSLLDYSP